MGLKHQYTVTIGNDDGSQAQFDILVSHRRDLTVLQNILQYGLDVGDSFEIEPDPFSRIDDLRDMLVQPDIYWTSRQPARQDD